MEKSLSQPSQVAHHKFECTLGEQRGLGFALTYQGSSWFIILGERLVCTIRQQKSDSSTINLYCRKIRREKKAGWRLLLGKVTRQGAGSRRSPHWNKGRCGASGSPLQRSICHWRRTEVTRACLVVLASDAYLDTINSGVLETITYEALCVPNGVTMCSSEKVGYTL